eukprot:gene2083-1264_t
MNIYIYIFMGGEALLVEIELKFSLQAGRCEGRRINWLKNCVYHTNNNNKKKRSSSAVLVVVKLAGTPTIQRPSNDEKKSTRNKAQHRKGIHHQWSPFGRSIKENQ